jgi:protein O-mannosyl-transferase
MTGRRSNDDAPHQRTASSSPTPDVSFANQPWLLASVLVIVTFLIYFPALRGGFVFDDNALIINNRLIQASNGLHRVWFTTEAPDYYPLTESLWLLEWRAWGRNAAGYHVVNVLLHAANAVLVWIVLQRLKVRGAWLAGLVFAIHPVNVATVAWISEQKNTLSMLLYLVAILLYLRFDEDGGWQWYGASLAAFLLALLSKTAVVALPVVLLGCLWWSRGRVRWKDVLRSVPFFLLSLVLGLVTVWFQYHRALAGISVRTNSFLARLATAGCAVWFYLYKALLPVNLMLIYPKWHVDTSYGGSYMPGALLVGCFLIFWWKRKTWGRPLLFGLGYFVAMLFPVLGFFHQGFYQYSLVSDHWQYYSIVGPIALVVAAAAIGRRVDQPGRSVGEVAALAALLLLGVATWTRAGVYASAETLWRDTLARNPNAWVAHNNLGLILQESGKVSEATEHYEQALRIEPDYAEAHNNLGLVLQRLGKVSEAVAHYEQALQIKPDFADAHDNLGTALAQTGKIKEAIAHFEQALRIEPDYAEAHNNLGLVLQRLGKVSEAIPHFEQALRIKPDFAEAHYNLGVALVQLGRPQEAMGHWQQALQVKPDYAEAHYNLGVALVQLGRIPEAIEHLQQALRIKPDFAPAQDALARLQAAQ